MYLFAHFFSLQGVRCILYIQLHLCLMTFHMTMGIVFYLTLQVELNLSQHNLYSHATSVTEK